MAGALELWEAGGLSVLGKVAPMAAFPAEKLHIVKSNIGILEEHARL